MIPLSPRTSYDHDPVCWPSHCADCRHNDSRDAAATQLYRGFVLDSDRIAGAVFAPWAALHLVSRAIWRAFKYTAPDFLLARHWSRGARVLFRRQKAWFLAAAFPAAGLGVVFA